MAKCLRNLETSSWRRLDGRDGSGLGPTKATPMSPMLLETPGVIQTIISSGQRLSHTMKPWCLHTTNNSTKLSFVVATGEIWEQDCEPVGWGMVMRKPRCEAGQGRRLRPNPLRYFSSATPCLPKESSPPPSTPFLTTKGAPKLSS